MSERMDTLPTRMIDAIDALPVPVGPGGLRPRARRTLLPRLDPVPIAILLVLVLVAVAATPVGRAAVSDLGRLIERLLGAGPWPAYYKALTTGPDGIQVERLMFSDGTFPGRGTEVASVVGLGGGWWSSDGSAHAVAAGPGIYIGDRSGVVRQVANVDPLRVMAVDWIGPDRIVAIGRADDKDWLIYIDVRSGDVSREPLPEAARAARRLGLLGAFDLGNVPPARKFSEDGRWVITGDQPCRSVAVYDLASDRRIELADGVRTLGVPIGWLRGSLLVWATCDLSTGTLRVRAGAPDVVATEIGNVPVLFGDVAVATVDTAHDRILFPGRAGDDWVISALTLDGQQTELVRLQVKIGSASGGIYPVGVSRDGRLLSFNVIDWIDAGTAGGYRERLIRAGVVDLETGEITWACEMYCRGVRLR